MEEETPPTPTVIRRAEHCVSRKNIDPDALKVMMRLHRHGYKAYLVGGGVRDLLLGREPKDFDVSTDARPGQIRKLFNNCRIIGRRFRLAHIYFRGHKIVEVSTFRKTPPVVTDEDEETGVAAKRGDNTFGLPHEDALRRDLTINGLFYDISNFSILDYVGGMEDLQAGILRTIGPPDERFREDPVRMLRIVRYAVRTGLRMEGETHAALLRNAPCLKDSNRFRLQDEFHKDLESSVFSSVLRVHSEMGLLPVIFPELDTYLRQSHHANETLFSPSWVWKALGSLDGATEPDDVVRERRIMSMIVPLVEDRARQIYGSMTEARKDPGGVKDLFRQVQTPFAVPRREQERFKIDLIGWLRLVDYVETKCLVPANYQKKAYFDRVLQWHLFHQHISGKPEQETRDIMDAAIRAGRTRKGRSRRRRKKRLRHRGKPLEFS
jgi:poly(A) polymerase